MSASSLLPLCKSVLPVPEKLALLVAVLAAHERSAHTNNPISNTAVKLSAVGSNDFAKALSCAICTFGGKHGPTAQARRILFYEGLDQIEAAIEQGKIIPGFGNSFFKDTIDPAWQPVDTELESYLEVHARIRQIEGLFRAKNKPIYANAACYTAAVCELVGIPEGLELLLLIYARLPVWAEHFVEARKGQKELYE